MKKVATSNFKEKEEEADSKKIQIMVLVKENSWIFFYVLLLKLNFIT